MSHRLFGIFNLGDNFNDKKDDLEQFIREKQKNNKNFKEKVKKQLKKYCILCKVMKKISSMCCE